MEFNSPILVGYFLFGPKALQPSKQQIDDACTAVSMSIDYAECIVQLATQPVQGDDDAFDAETAKQEATAFEQSHFVDHLSNASDADLESLLSLGDMTPGEIVSIFVDFWNTGLVNNKPCDFAERPIPDKPSMKVVFVGDTIPSDKDQQTEPYPEPYTEAYNAMKTARLLGLLEVFGIQ